MSSFRRLLVALAQHCYAMGRADGLKGVNAEDKELERIVEKFIFSGKDEPQK